jgi:gliding motility-associated-like protein
MNKALIMKLQKLILYRAQFLFIFGWLILPFYNFAQNAFTENKGQWDKEVLLRSSIGGHAFFLTQDGYVVLMQNSEDLEEIAAFYHGHSHDSLIQKKVINTRKAPLLRAHAYRVRLIGCNKSPKIIKEKPMQGYENFFIGADSTAWASHCKSFQSITYQDIYPGINIRYYVEGELLKYDFIVSPSGDPRNIKLQYEGADMLTLKQNILTVSTTCGNTYEKEPFTYQYNNDGKEHIKCRYKLKNNTLTFNVGAYDKKTNLIIDPSLIFSSFSRSTTDNWGFTATPGKDGSMYGAGVANPVGFPTTVGAFQVQGQGPSTGSPPPPDIVIIKLSPNGRDRIYATYLGGNGLEQPQSLIADQLGNLIVCGRTNSGNSFPGTLFGPGGGYDIFVTKLNASGTALIGSVKIGGTQNDGVNITENRFNGPASTLRNYGDDGRGEVILDKDNNILVAASTQSNDFFTRNPFQNTYGGNQDGVVVKINSDADNVLFSSFLGGSGTDAAFALCINSANAEIYVAGATTSINFPGVVPGVLQSGYNGGLVDGFLAKLKDNNFSMNLQNATFLGTDQIDLVYGVQIDQSGFPYVMGTSTGNWPIVNANYSIPNSRQFISKLQPNLSSFIYSTTFGSSGSLAPNISPVAFLVDNCENVYVSGWGGAANSFSSPPYPSAGTSGMPVTSDAFQAQTDGSDFYFFVLKKNASDILYGSYFGQRGGNGGLEHVDGGTSRFDAQGIIYQAACANCKLVPSGQPLQASYPITAGVFGNVNPASGGAACNLGLIKIRFDFTGVDVEIKALTARQLSFCLPATVRFEEPLRLAKEYIWVWGDGTKNDTVSQNTITHTFNSVGNFNIKLIGIDNSTCNIRDSAFLRIRVATDSVAINFNASRRAPCNSLTFDFFNFSDKLRSTRNFGPKSFVWKWGDGSPDDTIPGFAPNYATHTFPAPGRYNVRLELIDTNFCNVGESYDIINFNVTDNIRADFIIQNGCAPFTANIKDNSFGAVRYIWTTSDGQKSEMPEPAFLFSQPGEYTIKQKIFNDFSCNLIDSTEKKLTIFAPPKSGFSYTPFPSRENEPSNFFNEASQDVVKWNWDFGDGRKSDETNPIHQYIATGTYNVCQTVTNSQGCTDKACKPVEAIVSVSQDVATAFTPNGDGMNDVFLVRGFGIVNMTLRIFNRQGLLLFESKSQNIGWDGTYKGVQQPMDAYAWTLEVEYFTGEKTRRRGDVTLIR